MMTIEQVNKALSDAESKKVAITFSVFRKVGDELVEQIKTIAVLKRNVKVVGGCLVDTNDSLADFPTEVICSFDQLMEIKFYPEIRIANYSQKFNTSDAAKEIGLAAGSRIEKRINVEGEVYISTSCNEGGYVKCKIVLARMTESKNGKTTMKIWCLEYGIGGWFKDNVVEKDWWMFSEETLNAVKEALKG